MLEREGKTLDSARWAETMQTDSPYDKTISSQCYHTDFLTLQAMSEDDLKTIMTEFAAASGKPLKDDAHAEHLLQTLQNIDQHFQRPIYALAITDAWCHNQNPARWDKEQVLDALIHRELKFYYDRLYALSPSKISRTMRTEFETLLARSCFVPFLPLQLIDDSEYPTLRKRADALDMSLSELLCQTGCVHSVSVYIKQENNTRGRKQDCEAVLLDCPDLIQEYLVLRQALDKGQLDLLLPDDWDNTPIHLLFLQRILLDYPEKLDGQNKFLKIFYSGNPKSILPAEIYSHLLLGAMIQLQNHANESIERLEKLHYQFQNHENIAINYAMGIFNLSTEQTLPELYNSVDTLQYLQSQFPDNSKLAIIYATGIFNLSTEQTLPELYNSVDTLQLLQSQFSDNSELAIQFAKSIVILSTEQALPELYKSIDTLQLLQSQFSDNSELAIIYARGIVILSAKQALPELYKSINTLQLLQSQFPDNSELAIIYATGIVNLSTKQALPERSKSIDTLQLLQSQFPDNSELAVIYAYGIVDLSTKQALPEFSKSVDILRQLHSQFPDNKKIANEYAGSFVNLSFYQNTETEIQQTIKQAKQLMTQDDSNTKLQLSYAQTIFNLTLVQPPDALQKTVLQLRAFLQTHPDANIDFQTALTEYLNEHPEHVDRYAPLTIS